MQRTLSTPAQAPSQRFRPFGLERRPQQGCAVNGRFLFVALLAHSLLVTLALLPDTSHAASYGASGSIRTSAEYRPANGALEGNNDVLGFGFTDDPRALLPNVLSTASGVSIGGSASAMFKGSIGSLKAYSLATFPLGIGPFNTLLFTGNAKASAGGDFFDLLTVSGAGLAVGTPVSYRLDFSIDGTVTPASSQPSDPFYAYAIASVVLRDLSDGQRVMFDWNTSANTPGVYSLNLATKVGNTLKIEGSLGTATGVDALSPVVRRAEADFYHSALYSLTPSVAGLNTTGASGHSFLTPVPEPATWALFASGLLGLLWMQRRAMPSSPRSCSSSACC